MTALPNPWITGPISTNTPEAFGTARKAPNSSLLGELSRSTARASFFDEPPSNKGGHQGAPAVEPSNTVATAGATDDVSDVHEIFYHARRLINEQASRFRLDVRAFEEALEEPPLFLRTAGFRR